MTNHDNHSSAASDYEHGALYVYDATSQTFDRAQPQPVPVTAENKSVEDFDSSRIARNCDNWIAGTCQVCGVQWQNCEVHWSFNCPRFVWRHEITDADTPPLTRPQR